MPSPEYNSTLAQRIEVSPGLIILRVVPDEPLFSFEAGQYTVLGMLESAPRLEEADADEGPVRPTRMIKRAYSIASSSLADEYAEFNVTLVRSGELTPRLFNLGIKDRLFMGGKATGLFTLGRVPDEKHVLLMGTGTGLAPYMSMLRSQLVCGGPRQFVIVHGARYSWDLAYRDELAALSRHCLNMVYLPVVSRPHLDLSWRGLTGYLQDLLASGKIEKELGAALTPEVFDAFLCGNPSMIDAAKGFLESRGFRADQKALPGNLHTEEYW